MAMAPLSGCFEGIIGTSAKASGRQTWLRAYCWNAVASKNAGLNAQEPKRAFGDVLPLKCFT